MNTFKMDLNKWQGIIVEWVNCLNFEKNISQILELRNGEFFRKTLFELTQNKDSENAEEISIKEFIKQHYPLYTVDWENVLKLDPIELTYICSLLLHYCCIVDCHPKFINPVCEGLSSETQVYVKSFLEKLQLKTTINRNTLKSTITNIDKPTTPTKGYLGTPYNSPNKMPLKSPLQDFLKTPNKYLMSVEVYRKEVKSLKTQLDLERYEKFDLQEELKQQNEINSTLNNTIAAKTHEIASLRMELQIIESITPKKGPNDQNAHMVQKKLREEISELEKYIETLHKEQADLQGDKNHLNNKLKLLEEQCNEWQEKAIRAETCSTTLIEETEKQKLEITCLRSHSEELSSMLSEFRPKQTMDESYETDNPSAELQVSIDCDSLANTVVDVQLLEAQNENQQLKQKISDLELQNIKFNDQIGDLNTKICTVTEEFTCKTDKFNLDLENILINMEELSGNKSLNDISLIERLNSLFYTIFNSLQNEVERANEYEKDCNKLKNQVIDLNDIVTGLNDKIIASEIKNDNLNIHLQERESKLQYLQNTVTENLDNISELKLTLEDKNNVINDLNKLNENANIEIENIKEKINILQKEFDENLHSYQEFKKQAKNIANEYIEKMENLNTDIKNRDKKINNTANKISKLHDNIIYIISKLTDYENYKNCDSETIIDVIDENINEFDQRMMFILNAKDVNIEKLSIDNRKLVEDYNKYKEKMDITINDIKTSNKKYVNELLSEKQKEIDSKHQLQQFISDKNTEIDSKNNQIKILNDELLTLNNEMTAVLENHRDEIKILKDGYNILENMRKELEECFNVSQNELEHTLEEVAKLKIKNEDSLTKINDFENETKDLRSLIHEKESFIKELIQNNNKIVHDLENKIALLQTNEILLNNSLEKKNNNYQKLISEYEDLKNSYETTKNEHEKALSDKNNFIENLQSELNNNLRMVIDEKDLLENNYKKLILDHDFLKNRHENTCKYLENNKNKIDSIIKRVENAQNILRTHLKLSESFTEENSESSDSDNAENLSKIHFDMQENLQKALKSKSSMEKKLQKISDDIVKIKTYDSKNHEPLLNELEDTKTKLISFIEHIDNSNQIIESDIENADILFSDNSNVDTLIYESNILIKLMVDVVEENITLETKLNNITNRFESLEVVAQQEKRDLETTIKSNRKEHDEKIIFFETQIEKLNDNTINLKTELNHKSSEVNNLFESLQKMETEKKLLEKGIVTKENEIATYLELINKLKVEIQNFVKQLSNLEEENQREKRNYEEQIKESSAEYEIQIKNITTELDSKTNKFKLKIFEASKEVEMANKNISDLKTRMAQEIEKYQNKIKEICVERDTNSNELKIKLDEANKELEFAINNISDLETKLAQNIEKYENKIKEICVERDTNSNELNIKLRETNKELEFAKNNISDLETKLAQNIEKYENKIKEICVERDTNLSELNIQLDGANEELEFAKNNISDLETKLAQNIEKYENKIKKICVERDTKLSELNIKLDGANKELEFAKNNISDLETKLAQNIEKYENKIKEICVERDTKLSEFKVQFDSSISKLEIKMAQEIEIYEKKIKEISLESDTKLTELQLEFDRANKELVIVNNNISDLEQEIEKYKNKIKESDVKSYKVQLHLDAVNEKLQIANTNISDLETKLAQNIEKYENKIKEMCVERDTNSSELNIKLDGANKELEFAKNNISDLETKLAQNIEKYENKIKEICVERDTNLSELKMKLDETNKELEIASFNISDLETRLAQNIEKYENKIKESDTNSNELKRKLDETYKELEIASNNISDLETRLAQNIEKYENKIKEISTESDKNSNELKIKRDETNKELEIASNNISDLETRLAQNIEKYENKIKEIYLESESKSNEFKVQFDNSVSELEIKMAQEIEKYENKIKEISLESGTKLTELQLEFDVANKELVIVNNNIFELEQKIEKYKNKINESDTKSSEVQLELNAANEKLQIANKNISDLETKLAQNIEKYENKMKEICLEEERKLNDLEQKLDKANDDLKIANESISELENKLALEVDSYENKLKKLCLEQETKVNELELQLDTANGDIEIVNMNYFNLENRMVQETAKYNNLVKEIYTNSDLKIHELKLQIVSANKDLNSANKNILNLEAKIAEEIEKYDNKIKEICTENDKKINELQEQLNMARNENKILTQTYNNFIEKSSEELQRIKIELEEKIFEFANEKEKLNSEVKSLNMELSEAKIEKDTMSQTQNEFIENNKLIIETLKQEKDAFKNEYEVLNIKLQESEEKNMKTLKNLEIVILDKENLIEKLSEKETILTNTLQLNNDITTKLQNYQTENDKITNDNKELVTQLDNTIIEKQNLLKKYDDYIQSSNIQLNEIKLNSEAKISDLEIEKAKLQSKLEETENNLTKNCTDLEIIFTEKENLIKKLQGDIKEINNTLNQIVQENTDLERKYLETNKHNEENSKGLVIIVDNIKNTLVALETVFAENETTKENDNLINNLIKLSNDLYKLTPIILQKYKNALTEIDQTKIEIEIEKTTREEIDATKAELIRKIDNLIEENQQNVNEITILNDEIKILMNKQKEAEIQTFLIVLKLEKSLIEINDSKISHDNLLEKQRKIKQDMDKNINNNEERNKILEAQLNKVMDTIMQIKNVQQALENNLLEEKSMQKKLEDYISQLKIEKEYIIDLCFSCNENMHKLFKILNIDNIENDNDIKTDEEIKYKDITLEDQIKKLYFDKLNTEKEYTIILNYITRLIQDTDVFRAEREKLESEITNYEMTKADYLTLQEKYELLLHCDNENSILKTKISDFELNISSLESEIINYKKQLLDSEINKNKNENEIIGIKTQLENLQKIFSDNEHVRNELLSECRMLKAMNETLKGNEEQNNYFKQGLEEKIVNLELKNIEYVKTILTRDKEIDKLKENLSELLKDHKEAIAEIETADKQEFIKLRTAYTNLKSENSRIQLDCTILQKTIEDRNTHLGELTVIKEAYERLLEDNNKKNMELDTLRYKRARDKDEFKRLYEEERKKLIDSKDSEIQKVRNEYEVKLNKMKEKIVKLYRDEVDKERKKMVFEQGDQAQIMESVSKLKSQLWTLSTKYAELKKENVKLLDQLHNATRRLSEFPKVSSDVYGSRESIASMKERRVFPKSDVEERRTATLPKNMRTDFIEETLTVTRRRSINSIPPDFVMADGFKMEDEEGEMFNNTYLADMKAGRCITETSNRDSSVSRLSELQYRNSLCLPHLKSSYPLETQLISPGQFKEEDLKLGNPNLDDSITTVLLPGEKQRLKKDRSQTSYKKPGPPTPSKNGGRLSLQGNEAHPREVLREQNDNTKGTKAVTPSRIKALFMGRNSSSSSRDTENLPVTPRGKRLSFFRKQR